MHVLPPAHGPPPPSEPPPPPQHCWHCSALQRLGCAGPWLPASQLQGHALGPASGGRAALREKKGGCRLSLAQVIWQLDSAQFSHAAPAKMRAWSVSPSLLNSLLAPPTCSALMSAAWAVISDSKRCLYSLTWEVEGGERRACWGRRAGGRGGRVHVGRVHVDAGSQASALALATPGHAAIHMQRVL